jgi:hypothetical protein
VVENLSPKVLGVQGGKHQFTLKYIAGPASTLTDLSTQKVLEAEMN